ncbi:unnamed protein product [Sphagnum jensenii]|uniref:Uncharacterized protein n=1 Tax=Sphagnum jensenii TaxID=128206 RepID=A0ABP0VEG9_9BRYO
MRTNGELLLKFYRSLTEAIHKKEHITPAADWFTDNFHIVEEQLREIQQDLPVSFYRELPKLDLGDLKGYPRIYAIALALIAHTDSKLEIETISRFIQAFQTVSPLNTGELWALSITLRISLVENLSRLAKKIVSDHELQRLANERADALFASINDKKEISFLIASLLDGSEDPQDINHTYLAQLFKRLRDQDTELWPALEAVEKKLSALNSSPEKAVDLLHQTQASNQISVANVITSMRLLSGLNWRDFFESITQTQTKQLRLEILRFVDKSSKA